MVAFLGLMDNLSFLILLLFMENLVKARIAALAIPFILMVGYGFGVNWRYDLVKAVGFLKYIKISRSTTLFPMV